MSLPLIVTSDAEADVAEAYAWYEAQQTGLGERLIAHVEAALGHIRTTPRGFAEVLPGIRRVVVRKFPYAVFYRVDPAEVVVFAVYHSKRDPRGWQERI